MRAHRIAYAIENGRVPAGLLVCHSCDNRRCCNPAHLWLGTDADNNRDRAKKGRTVHQFGPGFDRNPRGERHGCAKLTAKQVEEVRVSPESGAALARRFGVSQTAISRIRTGRLWKAQALSDQGRGENG